MFSPVLLLWGLAGLTEAQLSSQVAALTSQAAALQGRVTAVQRTVAGSATRYSSKQKLANRFFYFYRL